MTDDLYYYLDLIQGMQLQALFMGLVAYLLAYSRRDSFSICLLLTIALKMIQVGADSFMWSRQDDPFWHPIVYHAWYMFFGITDWAFVFLTFYVCKRYKFRLTFGCYAIFYSYIALGLIQMLRYADRVVYETNYLGFAYRYTIPVINTTMTIVVSVYIIYLVYIKVAQQERSL